MFLYVYMGWIYRNTTIITATVRCIFRSWLCDIFVNKPVWLPPPHPPITLAIYKDHTHLFNADTHSLEWNYWCKTRTCYLYRALKYKSVHLSAANSPVCHLQRMTTSVFPELWPHHSVKIIFINTALNIVRIIY